MSEFNEVRPRGYYTLFSKTGLLWAIKEFAQHCVVSRYRKTNFQKLAWVVFERRFPYQRHAITGNTEAFDAVAVGKVVPIVESEPIDLSEETWHLVIHSYGPDEDSDDPGVSRITDVDFGAQPLGKWSEIEATKEHLHALGVSDMKYVSGTGEYTGVFTAPENWSDHAGAFLTFSYGKDQIGAVIVNGTELAAKQCQ